MKGVTEIILDTATTEKGTTTTETPTTLRGFVIIKPKNHSLIQINRKVETTTSAQNTEQAIDDPIIIPTVTYVNKTEIKEISNVIESVVPKVNGELIVQKTPKKEIMKKKPLTRRKGTLKATYGDKHEQFFLHILNNSMPTPSSSEMPVVKRVVLTKSPELVIHPIPHEKEVQINLEKKTKKETEQIKGESKIEFVVDTNNNNSMNVATSGHPETLPATHTITTITKNNIKSMHYRTKKPKVATQIKKPAILATNNDTKESDTNLKSVSTETENNKTKKKSALTEKYVVKTLKSINKEIHKIPPTPISETSKSLSEPPKLDIAPENKGGYEILDKNNLWELLKEGPEEDSKIEDKLQNRLLLTLSLNTTEHDNHSL